MQYWIELVLSHLYFSHFDHVMIAINLLIFLFSKRMVGGFSKTKDESVVASRLWTLRAINVAIFGLYFLAAFIRALEAENQSLHETALHISQTGLTLLAAFLAYHYFQSFVIRRYGREREIEGETIHTETYQSEVFGLLGLLITLLTMVLVIINIWNMTDWLQATSVLGGLALIAFATKDVWAPDNINGLILLYNGDIEPGSLVRIESENLLAIVIETSLTQTSMRDLVSRHQIIIPNSTFRHHKIDILSNGPNKGLEQYIDFNIGYGIASEQVEAFFEKVWECICELETGINTDKKPRLRLNHTGDHAVQWRFFYPLKNVYKLNEARFAINRCAYDLSLVEKIPLSTPLTHEIKNPIRLDQS